MSKLEKLKINKIYASIPLGLLLLILYRPNTFSFKALPPDVRDSVKIESTLLNESSSPDLSKNSKWWLNSGGLVDLDDNKIKTTQGQLPDSSYWRTIYAKNNPLDTDNGYHPQNIFRLVSRNKFQNLAQEVSFRITNDNLSESPNRNDSNGVLLFNRYLDGDNLYYTGLRVDGQAVIKKKQNGIYYTMAINPIFEGIYDRTTNPNLLPKETMVIKSEVFNVGKEVNIKLSVKKSQDSEWQLVLTAVDSETKYGVQPILQIGHTGIRTDFMDVEFEDYKIEELAL